MHNLLICSVVLVSMAQGLFAAQNGDDEALIAEAQRRLAEREADVWVDGERLCYAVRMDAESVMAIGADQIELRRLPGADAWYGSSRLERLGEAVFSSRFYDTSGDGFEAGPAVEPYRGPDAPPAPQRAEPLRGSVEQFDLEASALGADRTVHVYMPPGLSAEDIEVVVMLADGASAPEFAAVLEPLVLAGRVPATALVGVANGGSDFSRGPEGDFRAMEYLYGLDAYTEDADVSRFDAHMKFFCTVVPRWAREELGLVPERVYVFGASNGGAFAASAVALRSSVFDGAIVCSAGWDAVIPLIEPGEGPPMFFSAGLYEPDFLRLTKRIAAAAERAGRRVLVEERVGGHDSMIWQEQFVRGLMWLEQAAD